MEGDAAVKNVLVVVVTLLVWSSMVGAVLAIEPHPGALAPLAIALSALAGAVIVVGNAH